MPAQQPAASREDRSTPAATPSVGGGGTRSSLTQSLRQLSYVDGAAALVPGAEPGAEAAQAPVQASMREAKTQVVAQEVALDAPVQKKDAAAPAEGATPEAAPVADKPIEPPPWIDNDIVSARCVHMPELQSIMRYLKGKTYDSDVDGVLGILSHWDMGTIVGAWAAIHQIDPSGQWLGDILDNLGGDHVIRFPREVRGTLRSASKAWCATKLEDLDCDDKGEALYAHAIMVEHPSLAGPFGKNNPDDLEELTNTLRTQTKERLAIDSAINQKKEAQLEGEERARRMQVVEEDAYTKGADGKEDQQKAAALKGRVAQLEDKLTGNWAGHMTEDAAMKVFKIFKESLDSDKSGTELRLLCRRAEATKYMDWWLKNLPEGEVFKYGANLRTYLHILKNRPASAALAACEKLLSYGLFDWAVNDMEALLAYELIRSQPLSIQQQFREKDGGKWLARMEKNLKQEVIAEAPGSGKDGKPQEGDIRYNAKLDEAGELEEGGFGTASTKEEQERLDREEASYNKDGGRDLLAKIQTELSNDLAGKAQWALDCISGSGGDANLATDDLRGAVVRRLDAFGLVESLCEELGSALWTEANRGKVVALFTARDAMRGVAHIGRLIGKVVDLDTWVDTNKVKDAEALLAFELVKALPDYYRKLIIEKYPDWLPLIEDQMDQADKGVSGHNLYQGGKDQEDRRSLLEQLQDKALWACNPKDTKDHAAALHLEQVIRMAAAAGHRKLIYDTAKDKIDTFRDILVTTKIIDAEGKYLEKETAAEREASMLRGIGHGLDVLGQLDGEGQSEEEERSAKVELDEIQNATDGAIGGARFREVSDEEHAKGVNRADITLDPFKGSLTARIAGGLDIEEFRGQYGELTITTGPVKTGPMVITAEWVGTDPKSAGKRTHMHCEIDNPQVHDLLAVSAGSMTAVKRLGLKKLSFDLDDMPAGTDSATTSQEVADRVGRELGPDVISWIKAVLKSVSGGLPAQAADAAKGAGGMKLLATGLEIEGLATSGGQHAEKIDVAKIEAKLDALPYDHALSKVQLLEERISNAKGGRDPSAGPERIGQWQAEIDGIKASLPELKQERDAYLALYQKQKAGKAFEGDEAERFCALQDKMGQGGITLQVEGAHATGVGMRAGQNQATVDIGSVTAAGHGDMVGTGFLANPVAALQAGRENEATGATKEPVAKADGDVRISNVTATNLELGAGVADYAKQSKDKTELASRQESLDDKELKQLADLEALWAQPVDGPGGTYGTVVAELLKLEQLGAALQKNHTALAEHARLRGLIAQQGTSIDSMALKGISVKAEGAGSKDGEATGITGKAEASIDELDVTGVKQAGGKGIDNVHATDISGSADASILLGGDKRDGSLQEGSLHVGSAQLTGIHRGEGQADVDSLTIEGADITASTEADGGSISMHADRIEASAVELPSKIAQLEAELAQREAQLPKAKDGAAPEGMTAQRQLVDRLRRQIVELRLLPSRADTLGLEVAELKKRQSAAKTKAEKDKIAKDITKLEAKQKELLAEFEAANRTTAVGSASDPALSGSDVGVSVRGVGNFLQEDWSLADKMLDIGVNVGKIGVGSIALSAPSLDLSAASLKVADLKAEVRVFMEKTKEGIRPVPKLVASAHLGRFDATDLRLMIPVGAADKLADIRIPSGFIAGLDIDTLPLDQGFDLGTFKGGVTIDQAKVAMTAKIGDYFAAQGSVAITKKLTFASMGNGDLVFDPGNIDMQLGLEAGQEVPSGSVVEKLRGMGGSIALSGVKTPLTIVRQDGQVAGVTAKNARIGSLAVAGIRYNGPDGSLRLADGAMEDVQVDAQVDMLPAGKDAAPGTGPTVKSFVVKRLAIARVTGRGLHYDGKGKVIDLKSGTLNKVLVTDLVPAQQTFKLKVGDKGKPAVELDDFSFVQDGLSVSADARIGAINVESATQGGVTAKIDGVRATDVNVTSDGKSPIKNGTVGIDSVDGSYDPTKGIHGTVSGVSASGDLNVGGYTGRGQVGVDQITADAAADGKSGTVTADGVSGSVAMDPTNSNSYGTTKVGKSKVGVEWKENGDISTSFAIPSVANSGLHYWGMTAGKMLDIDLGSGSASLTNVKGKVDINIPPGTEKKARTIKLKTQLDVGQAAVTNTQIKYGSMILFMTSGALNHLYADDMEVTLEQSAPDEKGQRTTTTSDIQGDLGLGKTGGNGIDLSDAQAVMPHILSGRGSLHAGHLNVGLRGKDNMVFSLDQVSVDPKLAVASGWKVMGIEVDGTASAIGISGSSGPDGTDVHADRISANVGAKATGKTGGGQATDTEDSTEYVDLNLEVLDKLSGSLAITLPFGDGVRVTANMDKGELGNFSAVPVAGSGLPGFASKALEAAFQAATAQLLMQLKLIFANALKIRPIVEKAVKDALTKGSKAKAASSLQSDLMALFTSTGAWGALIDAAITGEVTRNAGETLDIAAKKALDALLDEEFAKNQQALNDAARADRLRTFIEEISVDSSLSAIGPFDGAMKGTNFKGNLAVALGLNGALGAGVKARLGLVASKIEAHGPDFDLEIGSGTASVGANVSSKDQTIGGDASAAVGLNDVNLHTGGPKPRPH